MSQKMEGHNQMMGVALESTVNNTIDVGNGDFEFDIMDFNTCLLDDNSLLSPTMEPWFDLIGDEAMSTDTVEEETKSEEENISELISNVEEDLMRWSGGVPTSSQVETEDQNHSFVLEAARQLLEAIKEQDEDTTADELARNIETSQTQFQPSPQIIKKETDTIRSPAAVVETSRACSVIVSGPASQDSRIRRASANSDNNISTGRKVVMPTALAFNSIDGRPASSTLPSVQLARAIPALPANFNHVKEETVMATAANNNIVNVQHMAYAAKEDGTANDGNSNSGVLDAMLKGRVICQEDEAADNLEITEDVIRNAAYTTSMIGEDNQRVIIIITQGAAISHQDGMTTGKEEDAASSIAVPSPAPSSVLGNDSVFGDSFGAASPAYTDAGSSSLHDFDAEWLPSPRPRRNVIAKRKRSSGWDFDEEGESDGNASLSVGSPPPRKKYQRKNPRVPAYLSQPYPENRAERKKAQNKTAAYKYRQKKLAQQDALDAELQGLQEYNAKLKEKLATVETEMKCMKRLMMETGLDKLAKTINI